MKLKEFIPIKNFENTHLVNKETQKIYSLIKKSFLKGYIQDGYVRFNLKNEMGHKSVALHRIMAETFLANPNNYNVINHKDGNKLNNSLENLEWCSSSWNNKEAYRLGLRKVSEKTIKQFKRDCLTDKHIRTAIENLRKSKKKAIENSKKVTCKRVLISKNGFQKEFNSEIDACNYIGVAKGSVGRVAKNPNYTIRGYKAIYL